jgi:hypothetical protein
VSTAHAPGTGSASQYVQIINGQIENIYGRKDLAFGIRNPRTDIYIQGYGYGELEQLITIVTAHLNAEEYNRKFFTQGSAPKGILNMKGDNWTPDQLEMFRRQWQSHGLWRRERVEDPDPSGRRSRVGRSRQVELRDGVRQVDGVPDQDRLRRVPHRPRRVELRSSRWRAADAAVRVSQEWKLKASRDRGLKPLLRFIAKMLNKNIIDKIDDHFTLEFVGLDEMSEQEKHEMLTSRSRAT